MASATCAGLRWAARTPCWDLVRARSVPFTSRARRQETYAHLESPRYLCWTGRHELALEVIQRLHRDPTDPGDSAAQAEFMQIQAQVEKDKEQKSGYIQMFTKPSWRKRSLLVLFIMYAFLARNALT